MPNVSFVLLHVYARKITDHCQIKLMSQSPRKILICVTKEEWKNFSFNREWGWNCRKNEINFSLSLSIAFARHELCGLNNQFTCVFVCHTLPPHFPSLSHPHLCSVRKPQNIHLMSFISIAPSLSLSPHFFLNFFLFYFKHQALKWNKVLRSKSDDLRSPWKE